MAHSVNLRQLPLLLQMAAAAAAAAAIQAQALRAENDPHTIIFASSAEHASRCSLIIKRRHP
jgi:hypothetical protein